MNLSEKAQKTISRLQEDENTEIYDYLEFLIQMEDIVIRQMENNHQQRIKLLSMSRDLREVLQSLKKE